MRWIVAIAALLTAAPSIPQTPSTTFRHNEAAIVRVFCQNGEGAVWGTAFKITATQYITARHVTNDRTCFVAGQQVLVHTEDEQHDYASFDGPRSDAVIEPSCEGFRRGKTYASRGFARGEPFNVFSPQIAFPLTLGGFQTFVGEPVIPGMSGGPMIDEQGRVVGINNMRWPNRSMPLRSTPLCVAAGRA